VGLGERGRAFVVGAGVGAVREWPHLLQKPLPGGLTIPHFGHTGFSLLPHPRQNWAPAGFSAWHFGHFTVNVSLLFRCPQSMTGALGCQVRRERLRKWNPFSQLPRESTTLDRSEEAWRDHYNP
jgi:hypothetical protein